MKLLKVIPIDISELKKCYLHTHLDVNCPNCKNKVPLIKEGYAAYPETGDIFTLQFFCNVCDRMITAPSKIRSAAVTLEIDFDKLEIEQ